MFKTVKSISIMAFALGCLVGCSDMGVDAKEAFAMPSDYSLDVYLKVNPDVKYQQIKKDIADNKQHNPLRSDSVNKAVILKDGSVLISWDVMPEGATFASDIRKAALLNQNADNKAFLADSNLVKDVFLKYMGLADSLWEGVENLTKAQKNAVLAFNIQQKGAPDTKADRKFLENFKFDETLLAEHYKLLGMLEGRAYRFCGEGDSKSTPITSLEVPVIEDASAIMRDYRGYFFCLDSATAVKYVVK